VAAIGLATAIVIASSQPADRLPAAFPHPDNLVHGAVYALLGAFVAVALGGPAAGRRAGLFALVVVVAYGFSDEWHQASVPGRQPSFSDLIADTLGAAAGILLVRRRARRKESHGPDPSLR